MTRSCDDTTGRALIEAAAALHNAANALSLCRAMVPSAAPEAGSGRTDMRGETIVDPVQAHIARALDAIAEEIGESAMLTATEA